MPISPNNNEKPHPVGWVRVDQIPRPRRNILAQSEESFLDPN